MKPGLLVIVWVVCLLSGPVIHADPIHAIAGGAYWHHDSGWVFPQKIGEFELVGIPQDVAGSQDAVAYYASIVNGTRVTASVDLYAPGSSSADAPPDGTATNLALDEARSLSARRFIETRALQSEGVGLYFVTAGEWRIQIRISGASVTEPMMDAFVQAQRWDTLTSVPTPR